MGPSDDEAMHLPHGEDAASACFVLESFFTTHKGTSISGVYVYRSYRIVAAGAWPQNNKGPLAYVAGLQI